MIIRQREIEVVKSARKRHTDAGTFQSLFESLYPLMDFMDFVVDDPDKWIIEYGIPKFYRIIRKYAECSGYRLWFNVNDGCRMFKLKKLI